MHNFSGTLNTATVTGGLILKLCKVVNLLLLFAAVVLMSQHNGDMTTLHFHNIFYISFRFQFLSLLLFAAAVCILSIHYCACK